MSEKEKQELFNVLLEQIRSDLIMAKAMCDLDLQRNLLNSITEKTNRIEELWKTQS